MTLYLAEMEMIRLWGNELINSIDGGAGDDTLRGNEGNDTLNGNIGNDVADYSYLNNSINVNLSLSEYQVINDGFGSKDTLLGIETIWASQTNDILIGSNDKDVIYGYVIVTGKQIGRAHV